MKPDPLAAPWDKLKQSQPGYPRSLSVQAGLDLPPQLELQTPVTVICGLNGSGKTRLLRAIEESNSDSRLVQIFELVSYLLKEFPRLRGDIDGLFEEQEPEPLDPKTLELVSEVVRREYEEVEWYTVEIEDSPFEALLNESVVPIFRATYAGRQYDFRSMGWGELSAHLVLWLVAYLGRDAPQALVLLDEPDTFMAPPTRQGILRHLLASALQGRRYLVASHSMELIQPALSADSAFLLSEQCGTSELVEPGFELRDHIAALYDQVEGVERIVFCEDEAAYLLTRELLRRSGSDTSTRGIRFLWCTGYGDLKKLWQHLPRPRVVPGGLPSFTLVADGDKNPEVLGEVTAHRRRVTENRAQPRWPLLTLPDDPNVLMKKAAEANADILAERLGVSLATLRGTFERLRGREKHLWVNSLLEDIDLPRQETLRALAYVATLIQMPSGSATHAFAETLTAADLLSGEN